ncbi:MAG: TadE family protein [Lachnospiraceae bacterium]
MKTGYRGFLTVEYALILPIGILSVLSMISMGIYLYNACLLQQNTCLVALQVRNEIGVEEEVDYQDIYNGLYHNKYLLTYDINSVVELKSSKIFVESSGNVLSLGIEGIFIDDDLSIASSVIVGERKNYLILHTLKMMKNIDVGATDE